MASRQTSAVELPDPAIGRVLEALDTHREAIVAELLSLAPGELSSYARVLASDRQRADMAAHIGEMIDAVRRAIAGRRPLAEDDLLFIRPHLRLRALEDVPLNDCLQAFRVLQRRLFEDVRDAAGEDAAGRGAALVVATALMELIDAASRVAADAYLEVQGLLVSRGSSVRRDLLEDLLSGVPPAPGERLNAARASGLDERTTCLVVVARPREPGHDPYALHSAAAAIGRRLGSPLEPLCVVRQDEIVVVAAVRADAMERASEDLRALQARLADQDLVLAIGVSPVQHGIAAIPEAYRHACLAVERLPPSGGVLALPLLTAFSFLTLQADAAVWHLLPAPARAFVVDDARDGGVLAQTLLAYFECDLNAKLAAERLFVHPNTVHYRLGKIADRTGCDLRRVTQVIELVVAIRMHANRADEFRAARPS